MKHFSNGSDYDKRALIGALLSGSVVFEKNSQLKKIDNTGSTPYSNFEMV